MKNSKILCLILALIFCPLVSQAATDITTTTTITTTTSTSPNIDSCLDIVKQELAKNESEIDFQKVIDYSKKILEIDPECNDAYVALAKAYIQKEQLGVAFGYLKTAISKNPQIAENYVLQAQIYHKYGQSNSAIANYTKALILEPENLNVLRLRAKEYNQQKKFINAIEDYTAIISINPDPTDYTNRGFLYLKKEYLDLAIADFTKAINLDDKDPKAYYGRACANFLQKEYNKTIEDIDMAIVLDPNYKYYNDLRTATYKCINHHNKAPKNIGEIMKFDPINQ